MEKKNIDVNADHNTHGKLEDGHIVFRCPHCRDYRRAINLKTGRVEVEKDEQNPFTHQGSFTRPGLDTNLYNPN